MEQSKPIAGTDGVDFINFYEREFYPLSNFSAFQVKYRGLDFPTSEHAYHFQKFCGCDDTGLCVIRQQIREAKSAHLAFKIAETFKDKRNPKWDEVKVEVMKEILTAKAEQHEYVRRKLLETGDKLLVECSWRDDFWGWGPNRDGRNMLGTLWMEVRHELRTKV